MDSITVAIRRFFVFCGVITPMVPTGIPKISRMVLPIDMIDSNTSLRGMECITFVGIVVPKMINGIVSANINSK